VKQQGKRQLLGALRRELRVKTLAGRLLESYKVSVFVQVWGMGDY
jgi:hypothetical protein